MTVRRAALGAAIAAWGAMLVACGGGGANPNIPAGSNTATIHLTWKTGWDLSSDTHVFVNGTEVGQVARAGSNSFQFIPRSGDNSLELRYEFQGAKCNWQGSFRVKPGEVFSLSFAPTEGGSFAIYSRSDAGSEATPTPMNLQLVGYTQKVPAGEEVVTSVQGVDQQVTRAHTIDQSADFSVATTRGLSGGLNLGVLSASVTAQVEQRRGVQLRTSQTITRGVTVSGATGGRRYKLVWYDLVREGTVDVPDGGGVKTLPFKYKEDAVLEVIAEN
jgi:hypothetical protein